MTSAARALLESRVATRPRGWLHARTSLRHFALVSYALPKERLAAHVPEERFEIAEFVLHGVKRALLSAVPFLDVDFRFPRLAPYPRFRFGQTNHRVYVTDRQSGEPGVWFLGTTLGSPLVAVPRHLWQLPWHRARYRFDCRYDPVRRAYARYALAIESQWCAGLVELADSGEPAGLLPGFASPDEQALLLTHPVTGFFRRRDGRLGRYSIWHPEMQLTRAAPVQLRFELYERLGLLSRAEMQRPHSALLCPAVEFEIHLPPRLLGPG
jgi:uncharacterized protein YqjF (DUF2071 family)